MNSFLIAPIAEGKGEVEALPKLLHRLFREVQPGRVLQVNPVIRVKASSFLRDEDYFRRYLELAARKAKGHPKGSILILLDCEDDCPAVLGPQLAARAQHVRPDVRTSVALAYREYETWFLAAARSLRGVAGLPSDLVPPPNPEAIRGAKEWLGERMPNGYDEINHQAMLSERFSFQEAAINDSFVHFRTKMDLAFAVV